MKKRLLWQLYPSYLLITFLCLAGIVWYANKSLREFYLHQLESDLAAQAWLIEYSLSALPSLEEGPSVDALAKRLGRGAAIRVTVVLPSGKVIGDSQENPQLMDNHRMRPEIQQAFQGRTGTSTRFSSTLEEKLLYVAVPVGNVQNPAAVVRTAVAVTAIDRELSGLYQRILLTGLVLALIMAALSLWISRRISEPLQQLKQGAERFARGELESRLTVSGSEEIGSLAVTMNRMAEQLSERIRTVVEQRNEVEGILANMVEGVLVVDAEERLVTLNQAAADRFGIHFEEGRGRTLQEIARNPEIQQIVRRALTGQSPVEEQIALVQPDGEECFLSVHGTLLKSVGGASSGALIVFHDVTELRRLENVRRQFVANVSHELRTPITSIKGFIETLMDGAADSPDDRKRFLEIVARHVERLSAIIEDLLALSRIEQGVERRTIALEPSSVKEVLCAAVQVCQVQAAETHMRIECLCDEALRAPMNAPLLEQAVVNLIDNAIKYSEPGGRVEVRAWEEEHRAILSVRDEGCGIAPEHQGRLFERFYRVDRGRSRKLGGTGLGLAIVKHIVQAHAGTVSVESAPGKGSAFRIEIPAVSG